MSETCDTAVVEPENPSLNETLRPWMHHPFGRPLVEKILQLYEKKVDIQSLASIVAVIGRGRRAPHHNRSLNEDVAKKNARSPLHGHAATSSPDIVNDFAAEVPLRSSSFVDLDKVASSVKTWSGKADQAGNRTKLTENM